MSNETTTTGPLSRLVFLYSRIPPYLTAQLRALIETGRVGAVDVVHWDRGENRGNHYALESIKGVSYHPRSNFDLNGLHALLQRTRPDLIYVSGWMDRDYLKALRRYRRAVTVPVVAGIDDQWHGGFRQHVGSLVAKLLLPKVIDVMWVAGAPQRVYAQRFGYTDSRVIPYLLSADIDRFGTAHVGLRRRFLFLGRFDSVKGLDILISAYEQLPRALRAQWPLELIGDGPLRPQLETRAAFSGIRLHPYVQPQGLPALLADGGVAVFPSRHEQWGVAIHELAAAGFPLILSDACGAGTEFLIHGHNGLRCQTGDVEKLTSAMRYIAELDGETRLHWAERSRQLAGRITPALSAASFLSLV